MQEDHTVSTRRTTISVSECVRNLYDSLRFCGCYNTYDEMMLDLAENVLDGRSLSPLKMDYPERNIRGLRHQIKIARKSLRKKKD